MGAKSAGRRLVGLLGLLAAAAFCLGATPAFVGGSAQGHRRAVASGVGAAASGAPGGAPAVDVVVLGASGFTGRLACEYLAEHAPPGVSWAMAGRNLLKLEEVRAGLPAAGRSVPLIRVDSTDVGAVQDLARRAKVIANFAGTPYYDKALPVVAACAETGCHYVDITGETPFMRTSADKFDAKARETGALIVHACGYDSVPFDLGALLAATEMRERHGVGCRRIRTYVGPSAGGFSGGTLYTGLSLMEAGEKVPGASAAQDPYGLDPPGGKGGLDRGDGGEQEGLMPHFDELEGTWTAPWIMASINARVVRRSNALLGYAYGPEMSYGEAAEVASPNLAYGMAASMVVGGALMAFPLSRSALLRWVLPAPGQGPSRPERDEGFFRIRTVALGEGTGGLAAAPRVVAHVESGDGGDPGYKCTARMSMEAALCLALERGRCRREGGVVTPAAGLGQALVERLRASGMRLYVETA